MSMRGGEPARLHEVDGVGREQLREGRRNLLRARAPIDELVQQRLEHKALTLVHQRDLPK